MRRALALLILVSAAPAEAQQQGSIQISTETQVLEGNAQRRASERTLEPDVGVLWSQPGARFASFQLELHATRRGDAAHLGRAWLSLRDALWGGLTWTVEAGDLYTTHTFSDYRFSNLTAPAITFTGGAVRAKSKKTTIDLIGGRSSAWRNIFGTDPDTLGQSLGLARASYEPAARLQLNARASRVRTSNLKEFTRTIDASDEAGGGAKLTLTPSFYLVGDAAYVRYRATGAPAAVRDYSFLGGAHLLLSRGWVQVNASRFSPGDLPVLNASLQDRSGTFAAGEYDLLRRVRLFGGWEDLETNIRPTGVALQRPSANATRGFEGVRLGIGSRSSFSMRVEQGDRVSRAVLTAAPLSPATAVPTTSDTGSLSAELQTTIGRTTTFARYTVRENVDSSFASATYTQRDAAAQFFVNLSRSTQLFGVATLANNRTAAGNGSTYLQISAGGQQRVFRPGLWLRLEGTASQNQDLVTGILAPRDALSVGLNGQLTPHTTIGFNVYVDRAPIGFPGEPNALLTRSTLRIVHTIPTGSVRVADAAGASRRTSRGSGTILGSVFADWNGNGRPDPGEDVLAGIPVALGSVSSVTTGRDGQFSFLNVPSGAQRVRLDLNALPVDFDPPQAAEVTLEVSKGETRRVAFGLVPLGTIRGRVFEDVNRNGKLDPGEPPVDGAVFVLDGGQRSELARKGQFRFEAVRAGLHRVELLKESLPDGAAVVGEADRDATIDRDRPQVDVLYLVTIEKRPELRKVFPSKGGTSTAPPSLPTGASVGQAGSRARAGSKQAPPALSRRSGKAAKAERPFAAAKAELPVGPIAELYTIQIAALTDGKNARAMVRALEEAGFPAYVVDPQAGAPDTLYRVRVGRYASRAASERTVRRLETQLRLKLWVTRGR